jgi:hypothetical protein
MTRRTVLPLLLFVLSLCGSARVATAADGLGTDPALFNKHLDAAIFRGDKAFLEAVIADDLKFSTLVNGGTVWSKAEWLGYVGKMKYVSREIITDQVERHENVAIATAKIHYQYVNAKPTEIVQLRVYQQRPAGWQLVSHRTIREEVIGATTSR